MTNPQPKQCFTCHLPLELSLSQQKNYDSVNKAGVQNKLSQIQCRDCVKKRSYSSSSSSSAASSSPSSSSSSSSSSSAAAAAASAVPTPSTLDRRESTSSFGVSRDRSGSGSNGSTNGSGVTTKAISGAGHQPIKRQ